MTELRRRRRVPSSLIALLWLTLLWACNTQVSAAENFVEFSVPEDFVGPIAIAYGVPNGIKLPEVTGNALSIAIPLSGQIAFQGHRPYRDEVILRVRRNGETLNISDMFTEVPSSSTPVAYGLRRIKQILPKPDGSTVTIWIDACLVGIPSDRIDATASVSAHADRYLGELARDAASNFSTDDDPDISPGKIALIREFLSLADMDAKNSADELEPLKAAYPHAPESFWNTQLESMTSELRDAVLIPYIDRKFSSSRLRELVSSGATSESLLEMAKLGAQDTELSEAMARWWYVRGQQLLDELEGRGYGREER